MFVHEGHRVKVKVTVAKNREIPHSRNVKLQSAITMVLENIQKFACSTGFLANVNVNVVHIRYVVVRPSVVCLLSVCCLSVCRL